MRNAVPSSISGLKYNVSHFLRGILFTVPTEKSWKKTGTGPGAALRCSHLDTCLPLRNRRELLQDTQTDWMYEGP